MKDKSFLHTFYEMEEKKIEDFFLFHFIKSV
jgi:hypothetical protein